MIDKSKINLAVKEELRKQRKLGEQTGGSGHLGFVSISELKHSDPKKIKFKGQDAYEVLVELETYTETEFEHSPEHDEMYKSRHRDKIILDENLNVLDYQKDV